MRVGSWSMVASAGLALAACQGEAPAPQGTPSPSAQATSEVAGREIRVLAFGDSLFAGYGLADPADSYPAQL